MNQLIDLDDMQIFLLSDQPTTCPCCGQRTDFEELAGGRQTHTCPNCKFQFITEEDENVQF